jgi:hypothetical protein
MQDLIISGRWVRQDDGIVQVHGAVDSLRVVPFGAANKCLLISLKGTIGTIGLSPEQAQHLADLLTRANPAPARDEGVAVAFGHQL